MRFVIMSLALLVGSFGVVCGCGPAEGPEGGPELDGFISGGLAGFECPPASAASGSCSDPDCAVACQADTPCDPAGPVCPPGYECNAADADPYCLPGKICQAASDCAAAEYCARGRISQGICTPVEAPSASCSSSAACDWPYWCTDGVCKLFCNDDECPTGMSCVESRCEAPG